MAPTIITTTTVPAVAEDSAAQPLDLIALADIKLELNITVTTNDVWLAKLITRASAAIRRYSNYAFQVQSYQDEIWQLRDPFPWQVPSRAMPLQLSQWPLTSVPSTAQTAPPVAPVLSAVAGGSLAAALYYVKITYVTPFGETAASLESFLSVAADSLLKVASPTGDSANIATGWNVYVGSASFGETKQNASPIAIGTPWTEPSGGLTAGAALPNYILIVENAPLCPSPLCEGTDFIADAAHAQLTRLFPIDLQPKSWGLPIIAQYAAGYADIPDDVQDACIRLVKARWFARQRDPLLRSQNAVGIYEASYFFGSGPGSSGDLPPDVEALLDRFRVPVIA